MCESLSEIALALKRLLSSVTRIRDGGELESVVKNALSWSQLHSMVGNMRFVDLCSEYQIQPEMSTDGWDMVFFGGKR